MFSIILTFIVLCFLFTTAVFHFKRRKLTKQPFITSGERFVIATLTFAATVAFVLVFIVDQLVNNAAYKAIRSYEALVVADKRQELEEQIVATVNETLTNDKLNTALQLNLVQIRAIVPPASILESAAAVVRSQNELKVKANEVEIAKKEAERMQALSSNSGSSIAYMDAQARLNISNAILNGKVQTIVVPQDFKGIVQVGK